MIPGFPVQVEARLVALRQFLALCIPSLHGARLVEYRGVDLLGAVDVALADLETQVTRSLSEGQRVDWLCRNGRLYLRTFAADAPAPSWERVFAEEDVADVRAILREAGLGDDA